LVICGETGCGKSTQLGQFILEDYFDQNNSNVNIICTQPRRISAISLAERVSSERNDRIGNIVGYSIRGESKSSKNTRLLFCTTGVLLRMIQTDTELKAITHVIIDEVHERGGNVL
jgi:HrpA-like RNA helicase